MYIQGKKDNTRRLEMKRLSASEAKTRLEAGERILWKDEYDDFFYMKDGELWYEDWRGWKDNHSEENWEIVNDPGTKLYTMEQ